MMGMRAMNMPYFGKWLTCRSRFAATVGVAAIGVLTVATPVLSRNPVGPEVLAPLMIQGAGKEAGLPVSTMPPSAASLEPDLQTFIGVHLFADEAAVGVLPRGQQDAVIRAYEARNYTPFWLHDGTWNEAARAVLRVFDEAGTHGFSPASYQVMTPASMDIDALAESDVRLSVAVVRYARDARGARLDRRKIGTLVMPALDLPQADEVLRAVAEAKENAGSVLEAYHPRALQYEALRKEFIALKKRADHDSSSPEARPPLPRRLALKVELEEKRVSLVRERFGLNRVEDAESEKHAEAAAVFQKEWGLGSDDARVPSKSDIARLALGIRINMERWRWFPHDLGHKHILVNVPEQSVKIVEDGNVVHNLAAIIGKPETPTPILSENMRYIVVNPSWYVPQSIVKKDILPMLARNPAQVARRGYEITRDGRTLLVRQPPGESNALGRLKFMFPNDLAIYLHDTPNRELFKQSMRALSHGCVRVDKPLLLAEYVLGNNWTQERLEHLIGGKERSIRLEKPLPIHLTYFTLAIDADGKIVKFPDVYGYDKRMKTAFESIDRAQEQLQETIH